ncbi:MAG: RNA methyltransferase [Candidatus Magasanikbacteria bacterium CG10_big_fil_rev_8_21_14_0_10_43_9]|nr:MAG: RNA methyltransferase [Candidatus Magasanikbacteria bacterium CG10_big_fil_rev_8_21_14_0_10_43_9]
MFRTADAFNISTLYLVGYTATPPKIQIDKVSLGAETWIPWEKREDLPALVQELKEQGYAIIALEKNSDSEDMSNLKLKMRNVQKVALIVGNEVDGIEEDILSSCDHIVHIPMLGKKESLNVSIAAGIAMYALRCQ